MSKIFRKLIYPFSYTALISRVLLRTISRAWKKRDKGKVLFRGEIIRQLYYTGVQIFPIIVAIAVFVGALLGFSISILLRQLGRPELMNKLFFVVVVRELAPLLTSIVVLFRTGSAVCTEFATNVYNEEIEMYRVQGIDIYKILICPRVVGITFAIFVMSVIFAAISCFSGVLILHIRTGVDFSTLLLNMIIQGSATGTLFFVFQTIASGLVISLICSIHGLRMKSASTKIPKVVSGAMIHSLFALFLVFFIRLLVII